MSSKKVRTQIEQKLNCELISRKKEIDNMVMDYVNSKANSDDDSDNDSDASADEAPKAVKRPAAAKNSSTAKKQKVNSDDDGSKDDDSDADFKSSRRQLSRAGKKKTSEKSTKKPRVKKVTFASQFVRLDVLTLILKRLQIYRMAKNAKAVDTHVH